MDLRRHHVWLPFPAGLLALNSGEVSDTDKPIHIVFSHSTTDTLEPIPEHTHTPASWTTAFSSTKTKLCGFSQVQEDVQKNLLE